MDAREAILARIADSAGGQAPEPFRLDLAKSRPLLDLFADRLTALGGKMVDWSDLAALSGRKWCVESSVGPFPAESGEFEPASAWNADLGVTRATVGVAETGTLLLAHGPAEHRLASLAPPHHVAILKQADLVLTLEEAFDRLPAGNAVLVTGPSRTADIEGVLVRGVHGPRDVWVIVDRA